MKQIRNRDLATHSGHADELKLSIDSNLLIKLQELNYTNDVIILRSVHSPLAGTALVLNGFGELR